MNNEYIHALQNIRDYRTDVTPDVAVNVMRFYAEQALATPAAQAQQPAGDGWISVGERLPDDRQAVAFIADTKDWETFAYLHGRPLGGTYDAKNNWFNVPGLSVAASHWMPLPPAPGLMEAE